MVLECVRIKNVPGSIRQRDIENEWGDLNIAHHGLVFLADRIYAFFEAKRDAEDAVARGFAHKSKTFKTKQIRYTDFRNKCLNIFVKYRRVHY